MNRHTIMLLFVFNLISYDMLSQENIKTNFYKLNIPKNTTVKTFAKNHEELANIDAYQFNADEKPKYIMYLMSNKTNVEITSINIDNYKDPKGGMVISFLVSMSLPLIVICNMIILICESVYVYYVQTINKFEINT